MLTGATSEAHEDSDIHPGQHVSKRPPDRTPGQSNMKKSSRMAPNSPMKGESPDEEDRDHVPATPQETPKGEENKRDVDMWEMVDMLQENMHLMQGRMGTLEKSNDMFKGQILEMIKSKEIMLSQMAEKDGKIQALEESFTCMMRDAKQQQSSRITVLEDKIKAVEEIAKNLENMKGRLARAETAANKASKQTEVDKIQVKMNTCERMLEEAQSDYNDCIKKVDEIQDQCSAYVNQMEEVMNVLKMQQSTKAPSENIMNKLGDDIENLSKEVENLRSTKDDGWKEVQNIRQKLNMEDADRTKRTFKIAMTFNKDGKRSGNGVLQGKDTTEKINHALSPLGLQPIYTEVARLLPAQGNKAECIIFRTSADQALAIRKGRIKLRGMGYGIFDVLNEDEKKRYDALMPEFIKARNQGQKVWWVRDRLFVVKEGARTPTEIKGTGEAARGRGGSSGSQPDENNK